MKKWICLLAALMLACPACTTAEEYAKFSRVAYGIFDTEIQLIGYTKDQNEFNQAADEVMAQLRDYHRIFDAYNSYPNLHNLWYVNAHAAKEPVEIPAPLFDLIVWCKEQWADGKEGVNIAMGAVLSLWHDFRTAGIEDPLNAQLPPMAALEEAAQHTDFSKVILDHEKRTVYFADPLLKLDIGAVAKGYAADLVAASLMEKMPSFLLSLGGNVIAGEPPRDGRLHWGVSVQDPDDFSGMLEVLYVDQLTVVTSGDYWRYYTVDGERYHHIIDPATLMPARHIQAVTVVCESSLLADYLSTTLFLMPYEEGRALIEATEGAEAIWSLMDGTVLMSDGMAKYARSMGATSR